MIAQRPPTRLTSRVLTLGSFAAATILGLSLALNVAGQTAAAGLVGNLGVVVLLFTPVAGLIATWSELRIARPAHGWMAVAVLVVLGLATLIALLARP